MYARPPRLATAQGDFSQMLETAFLDRLADHGALGVVSVLHGIYKREGGLTLSQIVAEMLTLG